MNLEIKTKRKAELEAGNERSYRELLEATRGRIQMDTSDMRRELLLEKLVEWGVVTEEQMLDFDIEFHEKVEQALNDGWAQVRESQKPNLKVVKKPGKLLGADGRPLV